MPIDPNSLLQDSETLQKTALSLLEQLDRSLANQSDHQTLLSELLKAQHNSKSEQMPTDQVLLLDAARRTRSSEDEAVAGDDDDGLDSDADAGQRPN